MNTRRKGVVLIQQALINVCAKAPLSALDEALNLSRQILTSGSSLLVTSD